MCSDVAPAIKQMEEDTQSKIDGKQERHSLLNSRRVKDFNKTTKPFLINKLVKAARAVTSYSQLLNTD